MALERTDPLVEHWLQPLIRRLDINPNLVTWASLPLALGCGFLIATAGSDASGGIQLALAGIGVLTGYVLDVLDGSIARFHKRCTPWGDYLDHTFDRVVDAILILSLGFNTVWVPERELAWWAILCTWLASYLGTQAMAAGLGRDLSGFGRNDRLALLALGLFVTAGEAWGAVDPGAVNGMVIALVGIIAGSLYTIVARFLLAWRRCST